MFRNNYVRFYNNDYRIISFDNNIIKLLKVDKINFPYDFDYSSVENTLQEFYMQIPIDDIENLFENTNFTYEKCTPFNSPYVLSNCYHTNPSTIINFDLVGLISLEELKFAGGLVPTYYLIPNYVFSWLGRHGK